MTPSGKRAAAAKGRAAVAPKAGLHPRSLHRSRYDFPLLIAAHPPLGAFVAINRFGDASIDFSDALAVKTLNQAILMQAYGITGWDIPSTYLCPPIPGRADYLHHLADLLSGLSRGGIPRGPSLRVLDVGVGANCIYPLIGHQVYGWEFIASDIDAQAIASARRILAANPALAGAVQLRLQTDPGKVFTGILPPGETCAASICNPPFHGSLREAQAGSERKWRNLGKEAAAPGRAPVRNFGGHGRELWCAGGEVGFVLRMISDSSAMPQACLWFTTLVSKESSLAPIRRGLTRADVRQHRIIEMAHGQKRSRILAWTFLEPRQQEARSAAWRS